MSDAAYSQCGMWLHLFIVVVQSATALAVAYLTTRAYRKNKQERQNGADTDK